MQEKFEKIISYLLWVRANKRAADFYRVPLWIHEALTLQVSGTCSRRDNRSGSKSKQHINPHICK